MHARIPRWDPGMRTRVTRLGDPRQCDIQQCFVKKNTTCANGDIPPNMENTARGTDHKCNVYTTYRPLSLVPPAGSCLCGQLGSATSSSFRPSNGHHCPRFSDSGHGAESNLRLASHLVALLHHFGLLSHGARLLPRPPGGRVSSGREASPIQGWSTTLIPISGERYDARYRCCRLKGSH
jgi:hypothetical protein